MTAFKAFWLMMDGCVNTSGISGGAANAAGIANSTDIHVASIRIIFFIVSRDRIILILENDQPVIKNPPMLRYFEHERIPRPHTAVVSQDSACESNSA
ncbi:MAG: hypothetical protein WB444_05260 [Gallionella sp.]